MAHSNTVTQDEWNGVYYDMKTGEFTLIDVEDDGVALRDPFTGDRYYTAETDEFVDKADEFTQLHPAVLDNPSETLLNAIIAAKRAHDGDMGPARDLDPIEIEFAQKCVSMERKDDMAWQDHVDGQ